MSSCNSVCPPLAEALVAANVGAAAAHANPAEPRPRLFA